MSEFEEAYEQDDARGRARAEQTLGEAVLNVPIRALDPRPAVWLPESATVREAIQLMLEQRVGAVLVVRDERAVGIFSERDVLRRVATGEVAPARPLSEVMTREPETLGLDDGIAFALNKMTVGGYRHIPIVDEAGAPLAVLSVREIVAYIVSLLPRRILNLPPEPGLEARSVDGG